MTSTSVTLQLSMRKRRKTDGFWV